MARRSTFIPSPAQMALWPAVSGNEINGLGAGASEPARPIYWHTEVATPHAALQKWFYAQSSGNARLNAARQERQRVIDAPLAPLAPVPETRSAEAWTELVTSSARANGADLVGVAEMRPEWVFQGYRATQRWIVMIGVAHDYEQMRHAPEDVAAAEVVRQYARGNRAAKAVASSLRSAGHEALPHGGPMAGPVVLIPPALACGFGELGKHGSIINRRLGSSFRLASVLTDVPLQPSAPDAFGADEFCTHCRVCVDACPPDAIFQTKQVVRGETKWYVDFDKCLPYFNETMGCGICIAVCPYSRPGVADNLVRKMATRRGRPGE